MDVLEAVRRAVAIVSYTVALAVLVAAQDVVDVIQVVQEDAREDAVAVVILDVLVAVGMAVALVAVAV